MPLVWGGALLGLGVHDALHGQMKLTFRDLQVATMLGAVLHRDAPSARPEIFDIFQHIGRDVRPFPEL